MLAQIRTVLYAVFVQPGDNWVGRNVISGGRTDSTLSSTAVGWSIVRNGGRLVNRQEVEFGC